MKGLIFWVLESHRHYMSRLYEKTSIIYSGVSFELRAVYTLNTRLYKMSQTKFNNSFSSIRVLMSGSKHFYLQFIQFWIWLSCKKFSNTNPSTAFIKTTYNNIISSDMLWVDFSIPFTFKTWDNRIAAERK